MRLLVTAAYFAFAAFLIQSNRGLPHHPKWIDGPGVYIFVVILGLVIFVGLPSGKK